MPCLALPSTVSQLIKLPVSSQAQNSSCVGYIRKGPIWSFHFVSIFGQCLQLPCTSLPSPTALAVQCPPPATESSVGLVGRGMPPSCHRLLLWYWLPCPAQLLPENPRLRCPWQTQLNSHQYQLLERITQRQDPPRWPVGCCLCGQPQKG